jgi:hypothetical protein
MMEKSTSPTTNAKDGAVQNNTEIIMLSSVQEPERMVLPTGKLQLLNAAYVHSNPRVVPFRPKHTV